MRLIYQVLGVTALLLLLVGFSAAQPCAKDTDCPGKSSCVLHACIADSSVDIGGVCVKTENCQNKLKCSSNRCIPDDVEIVFSQRLKRSHIEADVCQFDSDCPGNGSNYCNYKGRCTLRKQWRLGVGIGVALFFLVAFLFPLFVCFAAGRCCFKGQGPCGKRKTVDYAGQQPPAHTI